MTDRLEVLEGFRQRLQRAMDVCGYSQLDTARVTTLSRQAITQILAPETSHRARKMGPKLYQLTLLAAGLRVDPGWLAFGSGNPPEAKD
jgi:transcriptional regulator with XRE-family HTH domain